MKTKVLRVKSEGSLKFIFVIQFAAFTQQNQ